MSKRHYKYFPLDFIFFPVFSFKTDLRTPTLFHYSGQNSHLYFEGSKVALKFINFFSLLFHHKQLGFKLFFSKVNYMSHHHDVINRLLIRPSPKTLSVVFLRLHQNMDKKHVSIVFLRVCRCFCYHLFLQRLSDSQEKSICLQK